MIEKANYYAIIPANVRYANIPANAKLLYGEITALANKDGYCWANNTYFSKLYGVTNVSISKWISILEDNGFISRELIQAEGNNRKIYIGKFKTSQTKVKEVLNESLRPIKEKFKHNNTINNTSNIKENNIKEKRLKLGNYGNVFLTEKEIEKLKEDYGTSIYEKYLKELDEGIEMKGYKYKDFNLAMRAWIRRAGIQTKTEIKKVNIGF